MLKKIEKNSIIKKTIIFITFLIIASLSVLFSFSCKKASPTNFGYTGLDANNSIITEIKTVDETIEVTKEGTKYLYIGWEKCPWCQKYLPYYNDVLKENGVETLYYFSPYYIKGSEEIETDGVVSVKYKNIEYEKLVNWILTFDYDLSKGYLKMNKITATNEQTFGLPWVYVPLLFKIENGSIVDFVSVLEGHERDGINGKVKDFTKEQLNLLISKIKNL